MIEKNKINNKQWKIIKIKNKKFLKLNYFNLNIYILLS